MTAGGDQIRFDWRRGGAAAGGLVATLVLLAMVFLVAMSNRARDEALQLERHAYDVTLLTRSIEASISRSESALGRFVLDEDTDTSGNIYYQQWNLAARQIRQLKQFVAADNAQRKRVEELQTHYDDLGKQFANVARIVVGRSGDYGIGYYYAATRSPAGPALHSKLREIAVSERASLQRRIKETELFSARADQLTNYLSWLGVLVGLGAIILGAVAVQAIRQ
ncbi:MAG: histidine kinase, partial [Pseudomonadota bacterium]|nr:histidine kinase [Pseudomonadota bacterium]